MARETIGPYASEGEAADAAYRATRAAGEPHTITGLGATADAVAAWLVVRGRIRECWLEKKLAAPPTIAWPLFWISPASGKTEEAETNSVRDCGCTVNAKGEIVEPCLAHFPQTAPKPIFTAPPPTISEPGPAWPVPTDETPRPKGKKS